MIKNDNKTITDFLDASAAAFPEKTAFSDASRSETFSELRQEAALIGTQIAKRGIAKKPIAVFMDKKVECINAMLGTALSGNFYTVLDVHMPEARIAKIMEVLEPCAFVTDEAHKEEAAALIGAENLILYEEAMKGSVDEKLLCEARSEIALSDTLYVLFTSGSTGTPKGVIISHGAVMPYVEWLGKEFGINEDTVFANQTPLYFVMSGLDVFMTVYAGATCHIIPKRNFSFPVMLLNWLKEKKVNTLYWVPSILCLIANFQAIPEVHLDDLKNVFFGGEVMPAKQLNMWIKEYPDVKFVNMYGPTEMTDITSFYVVERNVDDNETLPMGKSVPYMKVMLLGDDDREVEPGGVGELCGTGPSLADGYYNNPEKTAEVFVNDPTDPESKRKMYRSGDLARIDENGDLVYMGRKDFQIKHMGHRIELGEIETAVSAIEGIMQNCCLYDTERSKIVLFYTGDADEDTIDAKLRTMVPDYMVPNRMERLERMPINLNGKIDRAELKKMV